jgi:hypothetical protein
MDTTSRRRTARRACVSATALIAVIGGGLAVSAGTAGASAGDPIATGCASDAYTVATKPITNGAGAVVRQTQLRYSPHCGTNWAKAVSNVGNAWLQAIVASPTDSASYSATSTSVYTDMVYAPNGVCAVATASLDNGPWSDYAVGC